MITKNKEEIEKIGKGCAITFSGEIDEYNCGTEYGELCDRCAGRLYERIKTSIQWCEDEIDGNCCEQEYLSYLINEIGGKGLEITKERFRNIKIEYKQLKSHLNWLKEQEKI